MNVGPGWFPDPATGRELRWWDGYQWTHHTQPLPGRTPSRVGEPAGFWQRVGALVIDSLAAGLATSVFSLPAQIAVQRDLQTVQRDFERDLEAGGSPAFGDFLHAMTQAYADHVVGLFLLPTLAMLAFHAGFLRWRGATPGKLALGIRVRRREGQADERLPWSTIAIRLLVQLGVPSLGYALVFASGSLAVFALGWLAISAYSLTDVLLATRADRRAGHDLAAGTVVVRTR